MRRFHVNLAVQQPQWVPFKPLMAILAQLMEMRPAPFQQRRAKGGPAPGIAERIDLELNLQPELTAQVIDHNDQFGVAGRIGAAENLHAELMELAETPFLRTLAPKHRAGIIEPLFRIAAIQPSLDIRPDDPRRAFRPQGDQRAVLVMIGKGVHLLFDDIRSFAAGTLIKLERSSKGILIS